MPTFGRPEDDDADLVGHALGARAAELPQARADLVQQIAGGDAVQRRERERLAQAERVVLERLVVPARIVQLVGHEQHRHAGAPQPVGQLEVGGARRRLGIDQEDDEIGLRDGELGLAHDLALEGAVVARIHAAGVDQRELVAAPLHDQLLAVARDAGLGVHDGLARRGEAVDERRLAGVRLADDRDGAEQDALADRQRLGRRLARAPGTRGFVAHAWPPASMLARSRGRPAAMAACVRRCSRSSSLWSSAVVARTASR